MEKKVHEFMVWQQDSLLYYSDFTNRLHDYQELANSHRIQNCEGLSKSLGAFIKQIHPQQSTEFKHFRTKEYQFNLLETINGVKFILVSSVRPDEEHLDKTMKKIYEAYIELVKRNYLYKHGDIINNPKFDAAIREILFSSK